MRTASAWRWLAPAEFLIGAHELRPIPKIALPRILELLNVDSLTAFQDHMNSFERGKIPAETQKTIGRLIHGGIGLGKGKKQLTFVLHTDKKALKLPYVLQPVKPPKAKLDISAFYITESGNDLNIVGRISVSTNKFLAPTNDKAREICELLFDSNTLEQDEIDDAANKTLCEWLTSIGVSKNMALNLVGEEDFGMRLKDSLTDVIEQIVEVGGSEKLNKIAGGLVVLESDEEEKGFSW